MRAGGPKPEGRGKALAKYPPACFPDDSVNRKSSATEVLFDSTASYRDAVRTRGRQDAGTAPFRPLTRFIRCAVERRRLLAGANPARQVSLQPVAIGAVEGGNDFG